MKDFILVWNKSSSWFADNLGTFLLIKYVKMGILFFSLPEHSKVKGKQLLLDLYSLLFQDQYRFCYKALWDYINMRMPGGTLTE